MSATLNAHEISDYFQGCPVIEIPRSSFQVQTTFMEEILELPLGLSDEFLKQSYFEMDRLYLAGRLCSWIHLQTPTTDGAILVFLDGWSSILKLKERLVSQMCSNWKILLLHGRMKNSDQQKVFQRYNGYRKIILATNIAESSITIDDVKFVIDLAWAKNSQYSYEEDVKQFGNIRVSKANLLQRRGRAGRVQNGECFHLITLEEYESLEPYPIPEILHTELEYHSLQIAIWLENMSFPISIPQLLSSCMAQPSPERIDLAIENLKDLDTLHTSLSVSSLGHLLARFSLHPKYAKVVMISCILGCLDSILNIICALSVTHIFILPLEKAEEDKIKEIKISLGKKSPFKSDFFLLLICIQLFCSHLETGEEEEFCNTHFLSHSHLLKILQMKVSLKREILSCIDKSLHPDNSSVLDRNNDNLHLVHLCLSYGLSSRFAVVKKISLLPKFAFRRWKDENQILKFFPGSQIDNRDIIPKSSKELQFVVFNELICKNGTNLAETASECSILSLLFSFHSGNYNENSDFESLYVNVSRSAQISLKFPLPPNFWCFCKLIHETIQKWSTSKLFLLPQEILFIDSISPILSSL